jgi:hypothetical protein
LRRIAQERKRCDAGWNVFYFSEHDVKWTDANVTELFDAGRKVGPCMPGFIEEDRRRVRLAGS